MKNINIQKLCEIVEEKTGRNFSWAPAYAEPSYTDPEKGILFGNWNPACGYGEGIAKTQQKRDPVTKLANIAEKLGYELEWEDEWCTCGDCGKAVRTQADSYQWTPFYRILNDCDLTCLDCIDPVEYLESIEDNANTACPPDWNPEDHGYIKHNGTFETGFHPGQNDRPETILKALHAEGKTGVIFRIKANSQFYTEWEAFYKPSEEL